MKWEQVDQRELERLYYEENLPDSAIAERFGIPKKEVTKKRRQYNISMRMHSIDVAFSKYRGTADKQFQEEISAFLSKDELNLLNQRAKERLVQRENIDAISKALTNYIFRLGLVEDMHANGKLSQEDMKALNIYMVNHLAWVLTRAFEGDWLRLEVLCNSLACYGKTWDPADPQAVENP